MVVPFCFCFFCLDCPLFFFDSTKFQGASYPSSIDSDSLSPRSSSSRTYSLVRTSSTRASMSTSSMRSPMLATTLWRLAAGT